MITYLEHYQIQHPDTRYEGVVTALQDLTREGHLLLTKEGLDRLFEVLDNDKSNGYLS